MQSKEGTPLVGLLERYVQITTADGRVFVGVLRGLDQTLNAVLTECEQRIYSPNQDVEVEPLGLYFLRGDTIVLIGELEQDTANLDWIKDRAQPLKPINMQ